MKKVSKQILLPAVWAISLLWLPFSISASEVDSFNQRFEPLADATVTLNNVANEMLKDALEKANQRQNGCHERTLYRELRRKFRNHVTDEFNTWLYQTDEVEVIRTPVEEGIYRDFNFFQSPIQGGWARIVRDPTGVILNVNGVRVGNDKFEHMMGSGYNYFRTYHQRGRPIESALAIGWRAETRFMGAFMTGVMAYGDLVANFQGMRFWNDMLGQHNDILGENQEPHIRCENDKWVAHRAIDFTRYIDHAFDEAINCSKFRTPKMLQDVKNRLQEYQDDDPLNRPFTCPMDPEKLREAKQPYLPWKEWLINTAGMQAMQEVDTRRPDRRN